MRISGAGRLSLKLNQTSADLSDVYKTLGTGKRVDSAVDDVGAFRLSTKLNADSRIYRVATQNINHGISAANIADSAVSALKDIVTRIRELATQAQSSSISTTQRAALQSESESLKTEYTRIVTTTEYNDMSLLSTAGSTSITYQVGLTSSANDRFTAIWGAGSGGTYAVPSSTTRGTGVFNAGITQFFIDDPDSIALGDANNDGKIDIFAYDYFGRLDFRFGNGNGTFGSVIQTNTIGGGWPYGEASTLAVGDLNGDSLADFVVMTKGNNLFQVRLSNGNGTFSTSQSDNIGISGTAPELKDINYDGVLDLLFGSETDSTAGFMIGNGNGTFKAFTTLAFPVSATPDSATAADFDGDGKLDIISGADGVNGFTFYKGNSNGTFAAGVQIATNSTINYYKSAIGDYNNDGKLDVMWRGSAASIALVLGNGNGTFGAATTFFTGLDNKTQLFSSDLDEDGKLDLAVFDLSNSKILIARGNGNGTFAPSTTYSVTGGPGYASYFNQASLSDVNGDGELDLVAYTRSNSWLHILIQQTTTGGSSLDGETASGGRIPDLTDVDLTSTIAADLSVEILDAAADSLTLTHAQIGAVQSRFAVQSSMTQAFASTLEGSYDRIVAVDVAQAVADKVALEVRRNAIVALMAQANQTAQNVASLLYSSFGKKN